MFLCVIGGLGLRSDMEYERFYVLSCEVVLCMIVLDIM